MSKVTDAEDLLINRADCADTCDTEPSQIAGGGGGGGGGGGEHPKQMAAAKNIFITVSRTRGYGISQTISEIGQQ